MAGKNATHADYGIAPATPPTVVEPTPPTPKDLTGTLNDDRLLFAEIAQSIVATEGWEDNAAMVALKAQCEARVTAIDAALKDD
jgi:hypothetical protein